ncbi:MAG: hypothetical protein QM698_05175 [Micropepsaceae bacterium]
MKPLLVLVASLSFLAAQARAECVMAPDDRAWAETALANWRIAERELLHLAPAPLPLIVVADGACTYQGTMDAGAAITWRAEPHEGEIVLPGGARVPPGPVSFASPAADGAPAFFVMTLPSVWAAAGGTSELGLTALMDGVMLHEIMHTRQFDLMAPKFATLDAPDDLDDDSLQARWKDDAAYVAAYEAERDALFAAAAATGDAEARTKAAEALASMRARRANFFAGPDAVWAVYDDIFLTMEGLGQWVAYAWFARERSDLNGDALLAAVRRGGRHWSQDEGLALFLVIDRLVPDWQAHAFAAEPEFAEALLARAAGE